MTLSPVADYLYRHHTALWQMCQYEWGVGGEEQDRVMYLPWDTYDQWRYEDHVRDLAKVFAHDAESLREWRRSSNGTKTVPRFINGCGYRRNGLKHIYEPLHWRAFKRTFGDDFLLLEYVPNRPRYRMFVPLFMRRADYDLWSMYCDANVDADDGNIVFLETGRVHFSLNYFERDHA
jgi:hypothetical protein